MSFASPNSLLQLCYGSKIHYGLLFYIGNMCKKLDDDFGNVIDMSDEEDNKNEIYHNILCVIVKSSSNVISLIY